MAKPLFAYYICLLLFFKFGTIKCDVTSKTPGSTALTLDLTTPAIPTTIIETTTVEPTTVEPTTVEPTTVEPTTVEPTTVEPTTVEPTTVEPTTVEPTTVEPTTVEPTTVEPTTDEPTTVEPTTVEPTTFQPKIEKSFTWSSTNMNQNSIVVTVDEGYFISATVTNVNMSDGNFLLIEGGDSRKVGATDGRIFANMVQGPLKYLFKKSSVYAYCDNTKGDLFNFNIKFERVGEVTTTTSTTTTTTVNVPTTEEPVSAYITVNVSGKALSEYKKSSVVQTFQTCVVGIAANYCKSQNINLTKSITNEYVIISSIDQCPYNWPGSEKCVQITFKLPIFYDDSSENIGYQLNSTHLEVMWLRLDELDSSRCFSNNSIENYDNPDFERSIVWWAIGITLVIVGFVVLLWFFRTFSTKLKTAMKKRQVRSSDAISIMSRKTNSVCSLTPHYLQDHLDTPNFFDN